ncbi:MAG: hypothetical protein JWM43_3786 [Acidobacteriaceae bacterium]|nr:hypothetical protein [Acidobacteriaceae bacterium]
MHKDAADKPRSQTLGPKLRHHKHVTKIGVSDEVRDDPCYANLSPTLEQAETERMTQGLLENFNRHSARPRRIAEELMDRSEVQSSKVGINVKRLSMPLH